MEDEIGAAHSTRQRLRIKQVGTFEAESGTTPGRLQKFLLSRGEVIEAGHLMTIGEQAVYQVTADKSGCASY
jgi:hypothetical protein